VNALGQPFSWVTILAAVPVGLLFGWWGARLIEQDRRIRQATPLSLGKRWGCMVGIAAAFVGLNLLLAWAVMGKWLETPEVQPSPQGLYLRQAYHAILIGLILVATVVDWDGYVIPDQITFPGMLVGLAGAFAIAQAQLIHLWVDWSLAVPGLRGPYFPDWFDAHRHWHGLAWSAAGLITGAGLIWLVRAVSGWLMGRETLGFGDVTFLAMIGSFLGWQPTVCAFLAAPLLGLIVGIPLKLLTNKPYLPYGPFLGAGAVLVLFGWGPIWFRTRGIFGDWFGLLSLAGVGGGGFLLLLGLVLAYRRIPGGTRSENSESEM
jgi:leader peptidase (prepilin peptidase)/N-methyltransferase